MKNPFIALFLFLTAAVAVTGCGPVAKQAEAAPPAPAAGVPVEVAPAENGDISLVLNYAGTLQAAKDVRLVPRVAGQVTRIFVAEGDAVKKGDSIAAIEQDVYRAQLKQAEAALEKGQLTLQKMEEGARPEELAAARAAVAIARAALADVKNPNDDTRTTAAANLAKAQAAVRLAQSEYDKVAWAGQAGMTKQGLLLEDATSSYEAALAAYNLQTNPTASKTATLDAQVVKSELDLALAEKPFRPVDFDLARASIKQAEAALQLAQLQLEYTTITAPFDGVVAELVVDEGSMVSSSVVLGRFISPQTEVTLNVEESRLGQVKKGQPVGLRVSAYPGVDFPAVVTNVAPIADSKSHTFKVTVTPLDEKSLLHGGMFADVRLLAEEKTNTLLVPLPAVTQVDGQPAVFVINAAGVAEQRPVTTGLSTDSQIEIMSGLKAGDNVVIAGQSNLTDGAAVNVVPNL